MKKKTTVKKKKSKASRSKKQKNLCDGCPAICCHDLAMMIEKPKTFGDIDTVSWYLHFDTVSIFIRSKKWYLLIKGKCIYLSDDYKCTIYQDRPDRCRRHHPDECERHGHYHDVVISTPDELLDYLGKKNPLKMKFPKPPHKAKARKIACL